MLHSRFRFCWFALALILVVGCNETDYQADRLLRSIWLGVKNYESAFGELPPQHSGQWRFSNRSMYKEVPWRGLLFDHMGSVGYSTDKGGLDSELMEFGKANFFVANGLVYSNFEQMKGRKLESIPDYCVIAFTVTSNHALTWDEKELSSVRSILNGESDFTIPQGGSFVLFANGLVGKLAKSDTNKSWPLFDETEASKIRLSDLNRMGVSLLLLSDSAREEARSMDK